MSVPNSARFDGLGLIYEASRPSYPPELVPYLMQQYGINRRSQVADVGSGTGKLSALWLDAGVAVHAIEPNEEFRRLASLQLGKHPRFHSLSGSAESLPLRDRSMHFISAAQAFHWFDPQAFRSECRRVLRPGGAVALIWNDRRLDTPFLKAYEEFLCIYSSGYEEIHANMIHEQRIRAFFVPALIEVKYFAYQQLLTRERLLERYRSCSYALKPTDYRYMEAVEHLECLFNRHQQDGQVAMNYTVYVFGAQFPE